MPVKIQILADCGAELSAWTHEDDLRVIICIDQPMCHPKKFALDYQTAVEFKSELGFCLDDLQNAIIRKQNHETESKEV